MATVELECVESPLLQRVVGGSEDAGIRRGWSIFWSHRAVAVLICVFAVCSVAAETFALPLLAAAAVLVGDESAPVPFVPTSFSLNMLLGVFVLLVALRSLFRIFADVLMARHGAALMLRVRIDLAAHFERVSSERQSLARERGFAGVLVNSCGQVLPMIGATVGAITAATSTVLMLAVAVYVSWSIALTTLVVGVVVVLLSKPLLSRARAEGAVKADADVAFLEEVRAALRTMRDASGLGVLWKSMTPVRNAASSASDASRRSAILTLLQPTVFQFAVLGVAAMLVFLISRSFNEATAELAASVLLLVRALGAAQALQSMRQQAAQLDPALVRVSEMVSILGPAMPDQDPDALRTWRSDAFELDRVSYVYPDGRVGLNDVTLRAKRGEVVGIVGRSGSGKSTLLDVIMGFRDPTSGDARAVSGSRSLSLEQLRRAGRIGYVPQRPELIEATIFENVQFFRSASPESVRQALDAAGLLEGELGRERESLIVGAEKNAVSGGQAQRIAIARAIVHDPDLIVLDEATSALDVESERAVTAAVDGLRGGPTIVLVTHRPTLLAACDTVIKLDNGRIVEVSRPLTS